jgi:hypothetical protein
MMMILSAAPKKGGRTPWQRAYRNPAERTAP